jgi:hypothetical protein
MRKWFILFIVLFQTILFAQQSEMRNVGSFRGIKVSGGIDVYLKKGDRQSVKVEVSGTAIDNVITEISGDYLRIHMAEGRYRGSRTVKVYVSYVELNKLTASSASNIYAEGTLKTKSLSLNASSAGTIEVTVDVESVTAGASSAADIELKGKARFVDIDVSSAGEVDAYDLETEEASISASSAGSAKITVKQKIEARASSGASIRYRGNPTKTNTSSSSGGSVKKSS